MIVLLESIDLILANYAGMIWEITTYYGLNHAGISNFRVA